MKNEYFDRKYFNKQPLKKTMQLFQIQIFEEFYRTAHCNPIILSTYIQHPQNLIFPVQKKYNGFLLTKYDLMLYQNQIFFVGRGCHHDPLTSQ